MSDKNDLISQFVGVTGTDADRAKFYLESSAWKLEVALASFYDQGDDVDPPEELETEGSDPRDVSAPVGGSSASLPEPAAQAKAPKKSSHSRFATLSSMHSNSDSESDDGQAYYAGGAEHGAGQQIIDPSKKKKKLNTDSLVQDMFKSAREHGAEEVSESDAPSTSVRRGPRFQGTAYRLGDTDAPSLSVPGMMAPQQPRQVDMVLKLWKEGFSIDDGPLRGYRDEENHEFLNSIKKGEVPRELIRLAKGGEVNLSMEDHKTEDYVKPKVMVRAFTGAGQRLGSPASIPVTSPSTASASSAALAAAASGPTFTLDESSPTTNLQIRLSDGSRLVQKFNHSHTVADVRQFIISQRPQFAESSFVLMTTFPNKEVTDESQTLETAKLLNAVLVQRLK